MPKPKPSKSDMSIGQFVKVFLPGESPWAEVVRFLPDGRWLGRIVNHLVSSDHEFSRQCSREWFGVDTPLPQLHDFKLDDLIIFERRKHDDFELWEPSDGQTKWMAPD